MYCTPQPSANGTRLLSTITLLQQKPQPNSSVMRASAIASVRMGCIVVLMCAGI